LASLALGVKPCARKSREERVCGPLLRLEPGEVDFREPFPQRGELNATQHDHALAEIGVELEVHREAQDAEGGRKTIVYNML
jgi:hypothetical protein